MSGECVRKCFEALYTDICIKDEVLNLNIVSLSNGCLRFLSIPLISPVIEQVTLRLENAVLSLCLLWNSSDEGPVLCTLSDLSKNKVSLF